MVLCGGLLAALATAGCFFLAGSVTAERLLRDAEVTSRSVAAFCFAYALSAWIFQLLALVGCFRPAVLLPTLAAALWLVLRFRSSITKHLFRLGNDLDVERRVLRDDLASRRWLAAALIFVTGVVVVRIVRTLVTPALGWDDFTYHLFRAGRWVQNAGVELEPAPDAWTYYEFFPWGGDLVWSWAMVWKTTDVLVPLCAITLWLAVLVAAYALARETGQGPSTALVIAAAVALLPSQLSQIGTAYVDNAALAMALAAGVFLLACLKRRSQFGAGFALGVACGLGVLVKTSFLPLMAASVAILTWRMLTRFRFVEVGAFIAGASVALPNLLFNWFHRGSPFYPFEIIGALPFNELNSRLLGAFGEGTAVHQWVRAARFLVVDSSPHGPFLNVGFLGALLLVMAFVGSWQLVRSSWGRWYLIWATSAAGITLVSFFSKEHSSLFTAWATVMGRLLLPGLAAVLVLSGLAGARAVRLVVVPLLLVELVSYGLCTWPAEMIVVVVKAAVLLLSALGLCWLMCRAPAKWLPRWPLPCVAAAVVLVGLVSIRESFRYDAYRLFDEGQIRDFHTMNGASQWPIWLALDHPTGQRLAVTAGFDNPVGHNWYRWPLLGHRLQNDVVYLPVTTNGEIVSYRDPGALETDADFDSWLRRVADGKVDRVVALAPKNIEHEWLSSHSDLFEIEMRLHDDDVLVANVDRTAVDAYLAGIVDPAAGPP